MTKIEQAVVLCAGHGERMLPFTKYYPKSLLPVKNKIALELVLEDAFSCDIKNLIVLVNNEDKLVQKVCKNFLKKYNKKCKCKFVKQKVLNGTGGALLCVKKFLKKAPFFLLFSDDVFSGRVSVCGQLEKVFNQTKKSVMAVRCVKDDEIKNYGLVKTEGEVVCEIVEKSNEVCENSLVNFGRYALLPEIFQCLKLVGKTDGEIFLTNAFNMLAKNKNLAFCKVKGRCGDIGNMKSYIECFKRW